MKGVNAMVRTTELQDEKMTFDWVKYVMEFGDTKMKRKAQVLVNTCLNNRLKREQKKATKEPTTEIDNDSDSISILSDQSSYDLSLTLYT